LSLAALLELAMCALFVDLSSQELVDDCSAQVAVSAAAAQPKQVSIGYLYSKNQCFASGFGLDPYPDPGSIYGSGISRRAKITHKNRKKLRNFLF
jgi:hypothetical protein